MIRYFIEHLRFASTWRLYNPPGWQGVVTGRCSDAFPTRWRARRWAVRQAWRFARDDVRLAREGIR